MSARAALRRVAASAVRPVLQYAKQSEAVRRLLIPMLLRFPPLARLARVLAGRARPAADIHLPVWPGPLPAEYLDLPASSRRALLDLARAAAPLDRPT